MFGNLLIEGTDSFFLAGPAEVLDESKETAWAAPHVTVRPDFGWILGRYVEADNVNENGHIFGLDDLRAAHATVVNTPLNMLHRNKYIVGTYTATEMLYPIAGAEDMAPDQLAAALEAARAETPMQRPYVEALAAFYRYIFPDEYTAVKKAHAEGSLFYCVDADTELMTADGWKRHDQLGEGDQILTMNTGTGVSEWLPCERVNRYEVDTDLIAMEGMMHSSLTTTNHRWWVRRKKSRGGTVHEWRTSETLTSLTSIPRAVPHDDFPAEAKYSDELVELVAWWWTEGTDPGRHTATIFQSESANPQNCTRIERCLRAVFGAPGRSGEGGVWTARRLERGEDHPTNPGGVMFHYELRTAAAETLREHAPDCVVRPEFLRSLTKAQLGLFIETSLAGDGTVSKTCGQTSLSQSADNGKGLDQIRMFEMACALAGIPTNTTLQEGLDASTWHCTLIRRSDWITPLADAARSAAKGIEAFTVERRHYQGTVWCPTTRNGTFLARRRGSVYWTGNSMEAVPRALRCPECPETANEYAYAGIQADTYCEHLNAVKSTKQLLQPHFVGGAMVLPPAKPGWKKADIKEVADLISANPEEAERVYEQVASSAPHLEPSQWEYVMALLLGGALGPVPALGRPLNPPEVDRRYNLAARTKLAKAGKAMSGGGYPIVDEVDLRNAIKTYGRATNPDTVKAHIIKRAKELKLAKLIPDDWK